MSRGFQLALTLLLGILLGALVEANVTPWYVRLTNPPAARQAVNLEIARQQLPRVEALLKSDKRVQEVQAGEYTGQDGAVWLFGHVQAEADLCLLMKSVADLRLPVAVAWQVKTWDAHE
jgi:hypothetical protein